MSEGTFWADDNILHLVLEEFCKDPWVGKHQTIR